LNINQIMFAVFLLFFITCTTTPTSNTVAQIDRSSMEKDTLPILPEVPLEYIMGKFDPAQDSNFVLVDKKHADREGLFLRKICYEAFINMRDSAQKDGLNFTIRSATRNFDYQKGIWERKWNGVTKVEGADLSKTIANAKERAAKILEYSSMPGTSRHHWGTDLDLNAFENSYFESGKGLEEFEWLQKNAAHFGFCRPYTTKDENRPNGYNEEKWHWSYLPLSKTFTQVAELHLQDSMIVGFAGDSTAVALKVVENYVLGINKACINK